jgi:hypothetical protein
MRSDAQAPQAVLQVEELVRQEVAAFTGKDAGDFFRATSIGET